MTRTRRLILVAATAIAATAGVIALSEVGHGRASFPTAGEPAPVATMDSLAGIPQSGAFLGDPRAGTTVAYYSDLQCPACSAFRTSASWRAILAKIKRGEVRLVYRAIQTATRDRRTFEAQQAAALAAGQQNRLWSYVDRFYAEQGIENSGYVNQSFLTRIARLVPGLDVGRWQVARHARALVDRVQSDERAALAAGVTGTPTLR